MHICLKIHMSTMRRRLSTQVNWPPLHYQFPHQQFHTKPTCLPTQTSGTAISDQFLFSVLTSSCRVMPATCHAPLSIWPNLLGRETSQTAMVIKYLKLTHLGKLPSISFRLYMKLAGTNYSCRIKTPSDTKYNCSSVTWHLGIKILAKEILWREFPHPSLSDFLANR